MIFTIVFSGSVSAANYSEGNWVQSNDGCGNFTDITNSYTNYIFNSNDGTFELSGDSYTTSMNGNAAKKYVFYTVSSDHKKLYAYIPSYNSNISFIDTNLGIPSGSCDLVYRVYKEVNSNLTGNTGNTDAGNTSVPNKDDNINENNNYEDYEEKPNDFFPSNGDDESLQNMNDTVRTTTNPSTGLSDYLIFLVPAVLVCGIVLILKRDKILSYIRL